jgi:hypothetical protein
LSTRRRQKRSLTEANAVDLDGTLLRGFGNFAKGRFMLKPANQNAKYWYERALAAGHSRADRYLEKAAECEHLAASVRDPQVGATFLDLANQWRDLARQVETLDR